MGMEENRIVRTVGFTWFPCRLNWLAPQSMFQTVKQLVLSMGCVSK